MHYRLDIVWPGTPYTGSMSDPRLTRHSGILGFIGMCIKNEGRTWNLGGFLSAGMVVIKAGRNLESYSPL